MIEKLKSLERFPANKDIVNNAQDSEKENAAIFLYGKRFYKDQTPVEYLAEFLLAFASPKQKNKEHSYTFNLNLDDDIYYWPEDRVALKLFSFFSSSKLETRHAIHKDAYVEMLSVVKNKIVGNKDQQEETLRLIQSLFSGFVGVAKNRTWVTYSFLPVTNGFLARELNWLHSKAIKEHTLKTWEDIATYSYFAHDRHNFMARGGELLYLQVVNFFLKQESIEIDNLLEKKAYHHLAHRIDGVKTRLEDKLHLMLDNSSPQLNCLVDFIEDALDGYDIKSTLKPASLGWVPNISYTESLLFVMEMDNICSSNIGTLEKLELLQILCCMQVLRSLCFQACRLDNENRQTIHFAGNYAWIPTDSEALSGTPIRQMAQNSFELIEEILFRVLKNNSKDSMGSEKEAEKHGFQIFRKLSKEIGLVIPRKGSSQRFTLHQGLLRFLVAVLVAPGERIRLTHFYQRVFAHYGIALGGEQIAIALNWCGNQVAGDSYAVSSNTAWVEEALQQGGFLVELSDAVSMVKNPG